MGCDKVIKKLEAISDPIIADFKHKRGSKAQNSYGVKVKDLRIIAGDIGVNHRLALELFNTGIHEARKLAGEIQKIESKSAQWVAAHALRELTGPKVNILGYPRRP